MGYEWHSWALEALVGIEPHEVTQALSTHQRWPRQATSKDGLPVFTLWARTHTGRPLIVAVRQIGDWDWLIIGAQEMTLVQETEFERWEADQDD